MADQKMLPDLEQNMKNHIKIPTYKKMIARLSVHGVMDYHESQNSCVRLVWLFTLCLAAILLTVEIYFTITT